MLWRKTIAAVLAALMLVAGCAVDPTPAPLPAGAYAVITLPWPDGRSVVCVLWARAGEHGGRCVLAGAVGGRW